MVYLYFMSWRKSHWFVFKKSLNLYLLIHSFNTTSHYKNTNIIHFLGYFLNINLRSRKS